VIYNKFNFFFT